MPIPAVISEHAKAWATDGEGRVTAVIADAHAFVEHGAAMAAVSPIRAIRIENPGDDWDVMHVATELGAQPWLARIEAVSIGLYSELGDGAALAHVLAAMPGLRELYVTDPATVLGVAHLPMPALHGVWISCEGSSQGDRALAALAKRPRALRELQAQGCGVTDAGLAAIAGWPLVALSLGGTVYAPDRITARGIAALASQLSTLDLYATGLDDAAVRALARSPLRSLAQLGLGENPEVSDVGLAALWSSPVIESVRELAIAGSGVTEIGVAALVAKHRGVTIVNALFTGWSG